MNRVDQLRRQDEFVAAVRRGGYSRRQILKIGAALGMSAPMVSGLARLGGVPGAAAQDAPVSMVGWGYSPEIVEDNVKNFEAAYDIDVEYRLTTGGNYHQIVETKFLGGDTPSCVYSETEYMHRWNKAGFTQNVEGMTGETTEWYKENILPFAVKNLTLADGTLGALPYYSGYNSFVYNQEHLDKAGLKPPTTWEEMLDQAKKLQTDGISAHPFLSAQNHGWAELSWSFFAICYSEGEPIFDDKNELTIADGGVAFGKVLNMHKQMLDEGITPPDIMTQEGESVPAWMTGEHSFMVVHDYDLQAFNMGENSKTKGITRNAIMPGSTRETFSWTACYLMGAKDVDRERTWPLMQWLGGKAKDGEYHGVKRWALEKGLGNPYPEVLDDPEVVASWEQWRDMEIHFQQLDQSKGRPVESTMWFSEWNWQMMTEIQEFMGGKRTEQEVIDNLTKLQAELKDLYPE